VIDNKINPLHKPNYILIREQMHKLIYQFISDGYSHNDVRIDNIGYDSENDLYVLFDFDKFNKSTTNNDINILDKSIRYYN
jgi:Ser/Thr protein kinase RdoA (MazF antagonist)